MRNSISTEGEENEARKSYMHKVLKLILQTEESI